MTLIVVLMTACKKDKKEEPTVYATETFPQKVILVIDNPSDPDFYEYLRGSSGVIRRVKIPRDNDMVEKLYNSEASYECVWIAHLAEGSGAVYFQLASDTSTYLKTVANRINDSQYMLWAGTGRGYYNEYLFRVHSRGRENGNKLTSMESLYYPHFFFATEGVTGEATSVRLLEFEDPKSARQVIWFSRIL